MSKYYAKSWFPGNAANLILIIQNWMVRTSAHLHPFGQFTVNTLKRDYEASAEGSVYKPMDCPAVHWQLDNDELSGDFRRALKRAFGDVGGLQAKGLPPFVQIEGRKTFYALMFKDGGRWATAPDQFWWTERSVQPESGEVYGGLPERDDYPVEDFGRQRLHSGGIYPNAYQVDMHCPGGRAEDNPGVLPLGRDLNGPRTSEVWGHEGLRNRAEWVEVCNLLVSVRNSFECEYTCVPKKESGNLSELVRAEDQSLLEGFTEDEFRAHKDNQFWASES